MTHRFRVWDGEHMHLPPHNFLLDSCGDLYLKMSLLFEWDSGLYLHPVDHESMHYTGLDDAEGTPVYEGDILEHQGEPKGVVEYRAGSGGFCIGSTPLLEDLLVPSYGITVCGNKFETPELLD